MKTSIKLGLLTLILFGVGGLLLIDFVQNRTIVQVLEAGQVIPIQVLAGLVIPIQVLAGLVTGLIASFIAIGIIARKFFEKERHFYHGLIARWDLDQGGMIFLSLCAGIGEELFFRGGIQPSPLDVFLKRVLIKMHIFLQIRHIKSNLQNDRT